jgi:tetratricopeptide (TPR) repeat protein
MLWAIGLTAAADNQEVSTPPRRLFDTLIHAGGSSWDEMIARETRHARYDTIDSPLPAFRIPLTPAGRPARVDEDVIPAGHTSPTNTPATPRDIQVKPAKTMIDQNIQAAAANSPTQDVEPLEAPSSPVAHGAKPLVLPTPVLPTKQNAEPSVSSSARLEPTDLQSSTLTWPTVIYRSSSVVLAVPDEKIGTIRMVRLMKLTGNGAGADLAAPVAQGKASLHALTSGTYEVTYVGDLSQSNAAKESRRIIIELEAPPKPLSFEWDQPNTKLRVEQPLTDEALSDEIEATWDRLERGAIYSSLRQFEEIVSSFIRPPSDNDASMDLNRVLAGQLSLETLEKSGQFSRDDVAEAWARQLNHQADLASAVYGLGRAYEMIESDPRPLQAETGRMAEACYRAAHLLDPSLPGPLRDLGLRLQDRGRDDDAGECFLEAARSAPDAETLLALGQWHLRRNEHRQASAAFEESHRLDPTFLPALLERARWAVVPATGAVYPSELRELTQGLKQLATSGDIAPSDRQWAQAQSIRLAWMEREIEANLVSLSSRRRINRAPTPIPQAPSGPSQTPALAAQQKQISRKIPTAVPSSMTVSPAVVRSRSSESVSVRPVGSSTANEASPNILQPGGVIEPLQSSRTNQPSSPKLIPRAHESRTLPAGANTQQPVRIPEAIPRRPTAVSQGDQP